MFGNLHVLPTRARGESVLSETYFAFKWIDSDLISHLPLTKRGGEGRERDGEMEMEREERRFWSVTYGWLNSLGQLRPIKANGDKYLVGFMRETVMSRGGGGWKRYLF